MTVMMFAGKAQNDEKEEERDKDTETDVKLPNEKKPDDKKKD